MTQIVVNKSTHVVTYSGYTFYFKPYLVCSGFFDNNCTPSTHDIIDNVTLPSPWLDGYYTYSNGTFTNIKTVPQTLAQQYATILSSGVQINSVGFPAINGVYPCDFSAQSAINAETTFINNFSEFTNGTTNSMPWLVSGGSVTFTSIALFLSIAKAIAQYISTANLASQGIGTFPTQPITVS